MRQTSPNRKQIRNMYRGNGGGSAVIAPPVLKPGQVRCPVCRNRTSTTVYGYLRKHRDLFGNDCYAKAADTT